MITDYSDNRISIRVFSAVLVVNLSGFELHYFGYDSYLIFMGFRVHLSLTLPLLFLISSSFVEDIKKIFKAQCNGSFIISLLILLIPVFVITASGLMTNLLQYKKPEYFYELGLSSIADFPLYLIWNLPQLLLFNCFLLLLKNKYTFTQVKLFFLTSALFLYEFYPHGEMSWLIIPAILSAIIFITVLLNYSANIFRNSVYIFFLLWIFVLIFGSSSKTLVNLLLASQYEQWEGFLHSPGIETEILFIIQVLVAACLIRYYELKVIDRKMS